MSEQLNNQQWLCFQIEDETYAQPVRKVREILDFLAPVPVPGAAGCVEGVLNIRGDIVTIVSARRLLGLDEVESDAEHIIVLETDSGLIGLCVDEVEKISLFNEQEMVANDKSSADSPVRGTVHHNGKLLILTDFERCINELDNYE
jgi:purine-binding chemotaxis protein CheW